MTWDGTMDSLSKTGSGLNATSDMMNTLKGIFQLNAKSKFARHMHERKIEALQNQLKMKKLSGDASKFAYLQGKSEADAAAMDGIRKNDNGIKRIASSMNSLGSQVIS